MDLKITKLRELCKEFVPSFGVNHAIVFESLLFCKPKIAKEIIEETKLDRSKAYKVLNDLTQVGLISMNNTNPATYYADDPEESFKEILDERTKELKTKYKDIIETINSIKEKEKMWYIKLDKDKVLIKGLRHEIEIDKNDMIFEEGMKLKERIEKRLELD